MVQERGETASGDLDSEVKSATAEIVKTNVKKEPPMFMPVTAGTADELELELIQPNMTQKPVLRGEVGAFRFTQLTSTAKKLGTRGLCTGLAYAPAEAGFVHRAPPPCICFPIIL